MRSPIVTLLMAAAPAAAAAQEPEPAPAAPVVPAPAPTVPQADALAQAGQRLQRALAAMMDLPTCGFSAEWGPVQKKGAADAGPRMIVLGGSTFGPVGPGEVSGTCSRDLLHVKDGDDELLFAGRRMLARNDTTGWSLRQGRYVDGASTGYVPDPLLLLEQLQAMELPVVHREPGSVDDRPVERVTVTLTQDQVAELTWAGLLPTGSGTGMPGIVAMRAAGVIAGGGGKEKARLAPAKPDATVDLAIALDPGTGMIHAIRGRILAEPAGPGLGVRVVAGGGAAVFGAEEEEEEEEQEAPARPPAFEVGLPVRPRKGKQVTEFELRFSDHGTAAFPALDERARELLGR